MAESEDERVEELGALEAIFPELVSDLKTFTVTLELAVTPSKPLLVRFRPELTRKNTHTNDASINLAYVERDVQLEHLPPLYLQITLPDDYPISAPPSVRLASRKGWLPGEKLHELEQDAMKWWEEYGRCQILFSYIDHLQQAAERGFDLDQSSDGCLVLPLSFEQHLISFDAERKLAIFQAGTFDCGICLEPKRGTACHKMAKCGHVFCLNCLRDCYNNAITEGDVRGVRCLDPTCGKDANGGSNRKKRKVERTLQPRELLAMGIEESDVRRYVEMKRKKKLEADKTTVYCPRTWCQGPAKSAKYPPIPADLTTCIDSSSSEEEESDTESPQSKHKSLKPVIPHPADRLAVCESCSLAFCRVCYMGWHGEFARCFPRDPHELSAEEKASYDYIRLHTSPCPTCASPTQKTMGCNHMRCFQCNTHFCYLCGAWLNGDNPYVHFNQPGRDCYQRLWELEEGDEGQGPADGRGFAGGRGWEQMALDVAREADAQEAAAAAMEDDEILQAAQDEDAGGPEQQEGNVHHLREPPAAELPDIIFDVPARQPEADVPRRVIQNQIEERMARQNPRPRLAEEPGIGRLPRNGATEVLAMLE